VLGVDDEHVRLRVDVGFAKQSVRQDLFVRTGTTVVQCSLHASDISLGE
jgi:hypothetical protein